MDIDWFSFRFLLIGCLESDTHRIERGPVVAIDAAQIVRDADDGQETVLATDSHQFAVLLRRHGDHRSVVDLSASSIPCDLVWQARPPAKSGTWKLSTGLDRWTRMSHT